MSLPHRMFLTALAPEERVQGSRDPLGLLPIWSRMGRRLVGNVTTVSGDLRGWTTLLVMVGLIRDRVDAGLLDEADIEPLFRAEQLVAYSRVLYATQSGATEVRGLNQVRKHLREHDQGKVPIRLGRQPERRILNAQEAAGVWGQVSSPAGASALLDRGRHALAPGAATLWREVFAPKLAPFSKRFTEVLRDERGFEPARADAELARTLAGLHDRRLLPAEVPLYQDHVLYGARGPTAPQGAFVELWRQQEDVHVRLAPDLHSTATLAQRARAADLPAVAAALEDVVAAERLLGPMERLFAWVQSRDRKTLDDVVAECAEEWDEPLHFAAMANDSVLAAPVGEVYPGPDVPKALAAVRDALVVGDWRAAVLGVIELNGITMRRRKGAPWIELRDGKLDVRLGDEMASLPRLDDVERELLHSYYLDPLRRLVVAWEDGQRG
jgi:hypothetical protein